MIRQNTIIEIKICERTYQFHCTSDSPLGEIHDALCMMKHEIVKRIQDAQNKEDQLKEKKDDSVVT